MAEGVPGFDPSVGAPEDQQPQGYDQGAVYGQDAGNVQQVYDQQAYDQHVPEAAPAAVDAVEAARARAAALAAQFATGHTSHDSAYDPAQDDQSGKRKQDDGHDDEPGAKRAAFVSQDGLAFPGPPMGMGVSGLEVFMCPGDKVGRVIGRAGITIKELQDRTGTRIQIDHKAASNDKPVTVSGNPQDVERCLQMIKDLVEGNDTGLIPNPGSGGGGGGGGEHETRNVECPQGIVGRVIGRGGETIRSLQQSSGAHILVNQDFPEGMPRQIVISGRGDSVERAYRMVQELISGDPSSATAVVQKYGMGQMEVLECPKTMVGRVIGRGGETIKSLQKQFNVSIQIDQNISPCKVTITGPPHAVHAARREVENLVNPNYGGPGGGPGGGGGGFQGGPGGPGGPRPSFPPMGGAPPFGGYQQPYPMPAYGGYQNPYGGYPAQPQFPGAAAGYPGAAAAGGYGGYPGYADAGSYGAAAYGGAGGAAAAPAAATVWQAIPDDQGRTYYYNTQTGASQWEKPADMP